DAVRAWARLVETLAAATDTEALDAAAARMALELAGAVEAWSFAWDEAGRPQRAPMHVSRGDAAPSTPPTALAIEARLARRPVARPEGSRTLGAAPVRDNACDAGALVVSLPKGADFGVDVAAPLAALAAEVALVRRALEAERRAEEAVQGVLAALTTALELRDGETERHSQRVQGLALDLAESLGVPQGSAEMAALRIGAVLHDIGKLVVPDAVLHKPSAGALDDGEWVAMHAHTGVGARIVRDVPPLRDAAALIEASHERWDGAGYPYGLAGEAIPLGARVFMLADAWDAMTTDRPYRRALPFEEAVAEIHRHSGTQFDPRVVEAFDRVVAGWIRRVGKGDRLAAAA
ncbi:MAG: HD domain-containing protein, partial [Dehalococcoidia bacterium]|nr:HD domain-containing protein [Dehalococcoidia bacterium]